MTRAIFNVLSCIVKRMVLFFCSTLFFPGISNAQQFPCDGKLYFFGNDSVSNFISYVDGYNTSNPVVNNLVALPPGFNQNALAANPADGYLYFLDLATYDLHQVDAAGNITLKCDSLVNSNKGCFDHLGRFWVLDYLNNLLAFDINTSDTVKGPFPVAVINGVDIVFNASDCHFYMADENQVNKIDTNGIVVASYTPGFAAGTGYGGLAVGSDGNIYGILNNVTPGQLYQYDLATLAPGGLVFTFPYGSTATPCGCDMASFPCPRLQSSFFSYPMSCGVPRTLQFTDLSVGLVNTWLWDFGDGAVDSVNLNPSHTYTAAGTYTVSLIIDAFSNCLYIKPDTFSTTITVNPNLNAVAAASGNVSCNGANNGSAAANPTGGTPPYSYLWSTGATTSSISNLSPGTYTVTVSDFSYVPTGPELVVNSDFSSGNTGFSSGYAYCNTANCLLAEGLYTVGANPPFFHPLFVGTDHTTGLGNFMIINGDSTGQIVWSQNIPAVLPNTNYIFSIWVSSVHASNPAQLQFAINNSTIGNPFTAPSTTGTWQQFYTIWNSGSNTSAIISIFNLNILAQGNDFGLDDISFRESTPCPVTDSVTITEPTILVAATTPANVLCNGGNDGTATANPSGGTPGYSYTWSNGQTAVSATGLIAGSYSVTITDANGCTDTDTLSISEPTLLNSSTAQTAVLCNGGTGAASVTPSGGTSGYSYTWSDGQSTVSATGLTAGDYSVTITDANGCTSTNSVTVTEPPVLLLSGSCNDSICAGDTTLLSVTASGGTPNYTYNWLPGLQMGPSISVSATSSATYSVTTTDANGCVSALQTCNVSVLPSPDALFDTTSNGLYGSIFAFNDLSTGSLSWFWMFGDGSTSTEQNPIHTFPGAGTYSVTQIVYNQFGCPDTFKIILDFVDGIIIPNVFTPDGDGINDVWYIPNSGLREFHVDIYDRWGLKVFESTADEIRWDGYSSAGKLLSDGTYYFVLKAVLASFNGDKDYSTKGYVTLLTTKRKEF